MKISEIFILTTRGETLISKKYRYDVPDNTVSMFADKMKAHGTKQAQLIPSLNINDIWFYHIRRNGLYFIATSKHGKLPILVIELLTKLFHICKDFCGVVTEDSIKENMVLIYEILDEMLDFGQIHIASTSKLKPCIQSDPVLVKSDTTPEILSAGLFGIEHRITPSYAADKPIVQLRSDEERRKNEIFVDLVERLSVLINADGSVGRCEATGKVNMKSFLVGSPMIKMAVNEDLTVGKNESDKVYGNQAHIDDVSFHACVKLDEFEESRILNIYPTEGEFSLMTYRLHGSMPKGLPFRLLCKIDETGKDLELIMNLRCEIASGSQAVKVVLKIPVPKNTQNITQQLSGPGQTAAFESKEKHIVWAMKNIPSGATMTAKFKLISADRHPANKMEIGPVAVEFEISSFLCSNLKVRFLRVFDKEHSYVPYRWIRYITCSDSYIIKL